jgi:hypothetical protein
MTDRDQIKADARSTIRRAREAIVKLQAGDYSGYRYCTGAEAARYITNRYEAAIAGAERIIDSLTLPEDLA